MCGCTDSRVRSQLRLTVWDHDKWTGDELVAGLWHPLDSGALIQNTFPGDDLSAPLPDPTWLPLRPLGHAATEEHVFVDAVRLAHPAGTLRRSAADSRDGAIRTVTTAHCTARCW